MENKETQKTIENSRFLVSVIYDQKGNFECVVFDKDNAFEVKTKFTHKEGE